jgi:hypothetical protein
MKSLRNALLGAVAIALTSCSVTMPVTVTNNSIGSKVGVASNSCLGALPATAVAMGQDFFPVSGGLCFNDKRYSLADAAKDGGISRIATVDLKETNYLIFFKYELIVTGE